MSTLALNPTGPFVTPRPMRFLAKRGEELLLALVLGVMITLPIAEIAMRLLGRGGVAASATIIQHGTLVLSMVGAALASREGRLLSIGTSAFLPMRVRSAAAVVATGGAAAVAAVLCAASARFVITERTDPRILAWGVPVWVVESALPIGFALIALRLIRRCSERWPARVLAAVFALATATGAVVVKEPPNAIIVAAFAAISAIALSGAPMFAVIGGTALAACIAANIPIASMTVSHYSLVVNPSLPAIPLFTLAGYVLAEGGASRRLVRVFDSLVGNIRGGPALVTVLACAFFTTFTGGSGVTILALGGLLLPILTQARYSERNALGLVTGAGALGILFPPCLPLILYAIAANVDVHALFRAGIVPGTLLLALTALLGTIQQPAGDHRKRFDGRAALRAAWYAKWELLLPPIVLTVLFAGFATPVEAAAITALYALFVEVVIHREYDASRLLSVFRECGLLVGGVLLILGVALGLTGFLVDAEVPQHTVDWVTANVHSRVIFLLLLNLGLILVGALMDIYSAIIVVVPLLVPLGAAFGIHPLHLGIIFLTNLELGYLVPPVGENLFIAAYRFDKPIGELVRAVLPIVAILLAGVLAVTYVPALSLWLVGAR